MGKDICNELKTNSSQDISIEELIARRRAIKEETFIDLRANGLREIKEEFNLPEKAVLFYPACGVDNSPSLAFPEWKIVYMDAVNTTISGINPHDIVIRGDLMNSPFDTNITQYDVAMIVSPGIHFASFTPEYIKEVVKYIKPGGLLICDNYHETATDVREELSNTLKEIGNNQSELKVFQKIVDYTNLESQ